MDRCLLHQIPRRFDQILTLKYKIHHRSPFTAQLNYTFTLLSGIEKFSILPKLSVCETNINNFDHYRIKQTSIEMRHRNKFNPDNSAPYELSRSRIENFVRCPACFYLQQVRSVPFPSIPGFNINEATDILLKRDFDKYRGSETTHPFLKAIGLEHLVPYQHEDFEKWTQSLHFGAEGRMNTVHEESNIKLGGGLDDVWFNTKQEELHIVDYKSTSQKIKGKKITLDDPWKASYKRQMDMYVWVMRRKGFNVSRTGYFLYCDGIDLLKKTS